MGPLVLLKTEASIFMEYPLLSDQQLLEECSRDNLKAFNVLFDRYFTKLYRYALGYVNDECFAEEAMMDLMMWIWEKRHSLNIQGEFKHYIFRAAKNATIKAIRKKAIQSAPIESIENHISFTSHTADHAILTSELEQCYQNELDLLSPQRKIVFQLSREEELSHAEIADNLDISINTVKNHIKFSLNHFRKGFLRYKDAALIIGIMLFLR
ncbi:RNA polymerase sigma factor [Pedobacter sp. UBA5917]|uniref:RNA polymerase sigma factor n=1 Tax=Pedobacter sp. UBA5917 TaxID=1947061 RepID=UPI0025CE23BF|nr:RNA polymerase sigma-70 factor [Pedobacter sp. UBA5917]